MGDVDALVRALVERFQLLQEQPAPRQTDAPAAWDLVRDDLSGEAGLTRLFGDDEGGRGARTTIQQIVLGFAGCRDRLGLDRYRMRLQARNGRDAVADYLLERLDSLVYLRCEIWNQENPENGVRDDGRVEALRGLYAADLVTIGPAVMLWACTVVEDLGVDASPLTAEA